MFINITDCQHFKYCILGVRKFCTRHGISFTLLIHGELPLEEFERTNDAMALTVVSYIRGGRNG